MRQRILLLTIGIVLVAAFVGAVLLRGTSQPRSTQATIAPLSYVNSITGQVTEDKPAETGGQTPSPTPPAARVSIFGAQLFTHYLTDEQLGNLQLSINNFLMARSGLESVTAGVQHSTITPIDDQTIEFKLMVVKPQATYRVTVHTANQFQAVPDIQFNEVEG